MLSFPLLKQNIKSNYAMCITFLVILLTGMLAVIGLDEQAHAASGFLTSYFSEFTFYIVPSIFSIILAGRLTARLIDRGTMAYFLATPNSRAKIIFTQAFTLLASLIVMFAFITVFGISVGLNQFVEKCSGMSFAALNLGAFCLQAFVSGLGFLASCAMKNAVRAWTFSGGITAVFYLLHIMSGLDERLEVLKYGTFFTLFYPDFILEENINAIWMLAVLAVSGILIYFIGIKIFEKRDLSL